MSETRLWRAPAAGPGRPALGGRLLVVGGLIVGASIRHFRICFVCLGNICRSPTAEAVMRHRVAEAGLDGAIVVESAGTVARA